MKKKTNLFNIHTANYPLWRSTNSSTSHEPLTFAKLQKAIAAHKERGRGAAHSSYSV